MSAKDTVRGFVEAMNRGDVNAAINLCADDLQFIGPAPTTLGRDELRAMTTALHGAFPDWNFNATDYRENGDKCTCRFDITGTQKGDLDLPFQGMPHVRATGKSIKMPTEYPEFTVKNGKISRMQVKMGPDGGLVGILKQLGASMPSQANVAGGRPSAPSHP